MKALGFFLIIFIVWANAYPELLGKWAAQVAKAYEDARK